MEWLCPQKVIIAFEKFFLFWVLIEKERLEGKISECLFFCVKILKDNSVIFTKYFVFRRGNIFKVMKI